jgi:rhodanese-related sulfurtransferase
MPFTPQDVEANRVSLGAWLRFTRPMSEVAARAKGGTSPDGFVLLDVRSRDDFARGHVWGALNVPLDEVETLATRLPKDKEVVTYCGGGTCMASPRAAFKLAELGFFARVMNAGWKEWTQAGLPVHAGAVAPGQIACDCSLGLVPPAPRFETEPKPAEEKSAKAEAKPAPKAAAPAAKPAPRDAEPAAAGAEAAPSKAEEEPVPADESQAGPEEKEDKEETQPATAESAPAESEETIETPPEKQQAEAARSDASKSSSDPSSASGAPATAPGVAAGAKEKDEIPPDERLRRLSAREQSAAPAQPAAPSAKPAAAAAPKPAAAAPPSSPADASSRGRPAPTKPGATPPSKSGPPPKPASR